MSPSTWPAASCFAQLRSGLGTDDSIAFLRAAVAFFDSKRIRTERVLTDILRPLVK